MNPCTWLAGGGAGGGGSGAGNGKGGDGSASAEGDNAKTDPDGGGKGAGECGQGGNGGCTNCGAHTSVGDPIDVTSGEVFTLQRRLLDLPGPIALSFDYSYSSRATDDVGLGHGWSHTFSWRLTLERRHVLVRTAFGGLVRFELAEVGRAVMGTGGWVLVKRPDGTFTLDTNDEFLHQFTPSARDKKEFLLTRIQHRTSANISLYYGPLGDLKVIFDSVGRRIDFKTTREGRIAAFSISDAASSREIVFGQFAYDARGNLVAATNADAETVTYGYADSDSLLTHYTLPSGLTFQFAYDRARRGIETWGSYGAAGDPALDVDLPLFLADGVTRAKGIYHVKLTYGEDGFTEVVDSTRVLRFMANEAGQIEKAVGNGGVTDRQFDDRANMVQHVDAAGAKTTYEWDVRGKLLGETDALGRTFRIIRDSNGLVVKNFDYAGNVVECVRDLDGNPVQVVNQSGAITLYAYNDIGQVTERIEPNGGKTRFVGDRHENLIEMATPDGATWRWTWDFFGRPIERVDPAGAITTYTYSDAGRLLRIVEPGGRTVHLDRDRMGNLTALSDSSGTTRWAWGGLNWLVAQTFPDGSAVNFRYNRQGWLTKMLNERGQELRIDHDITGQISQLRSFDHSTLKNKYDAMLRPVQQENSLRERLTISYDVAGRPTNYEYEDGTAETVVYDIRDEISSIEGPGATVVYDRNAVGSIVRETTTIDGETFVVEANVDAMERRVQIRSSLGFKQDIQRDVMTRVAETILNDSYRIRMRRDARGLLLSQLLPAGGTIDSEYDERYRLVRRRASSPRPQARAVGPNEPEWIGEGRDGLQIDRGYDYSLDDDLVESWDRDDGITKFAYDLRHRLVRKEPEKRNPPETFSHDLTSNVYEGASVRSYDLGNRLLRKDTTEYVWNDAGRLIEKRRQISADQAEIWHYEWNAQGLLSAVNCPDGRRLEFSYDPFARRVLKRVSRLDEYGTQTVESTTRFVWDRAFLLHEVRDDAVGEGFQRRIRTYCYDETSLTPLAHRDELPGQPPGEWFHYVCDPIDTPEQLISGDGSVAARLERSAYGVTRLAPGSRTNTSLRFEGQYYDEETGLAYNHHRYYDPEQCRYIRADPLGATAALNNFFQYTLNPVGYCDPLGLEHQAKTTFQPANSKETYKPVGDNVNSGGVLTSGWASDGVVRNIPGAESKNDSRQPRPDEHGGTITQNQSQSTAHTERHAMEWAERNFEPDELKGGKLGMGGQLPPCPSCSRAMREWSDRTGCKVDYSWPKNQKIAYHPNSPTSPKSGGPGTDAFCRDYHRNLDDRDNTATQRYHAEQNDMRRSGLHPDNQNLGDTTTRDSRGRTAADRVNEANAQPPSERI